MSQTVLDKYDFIVVGGGPAGSILASRLAKTPKAPSVLLLEAGTADTDPKALFIADRYTNFYKFPKYNWGYKTVPQPQLDDREIDYSRGKGLGGSTRINFATYTIGPKDDYDHWADLVEDDFFGWEKVQKRFVGFESFDLNVPERNRPYANPSSVMHGINNGVPVSYPPVLQDGLTDMFDVVEKHGIPVNLDLNSGDPIGMALSPTAGLNGYRATAQTAFLKDGNIPMNLTIVTSAFATKIILEGKKAVGIEAGGKSYYATKEIILSTGAIDTPKLLLISGIGPEEELSKHGIKMAHELSGVGKNLQDHFFFPLIMKRKSGQPNPFAILGDPDALAKAEDQFTSSASGPFTVLNGCTLMGFIRPSLALLSSSVFSALPDITRKHAQRSTVPTWELAIHAPPIVPNATPGQSYLTMLIIGQLPQSRGTITLKSKNPDDAPLCDPQILSHPLDRAIAVEAARRAWAIMSDPAAQADLDDALAAPASMDEEDILSFVQRTANTTWHMSCTAKMGRNDDTNAVVDTKFRVRGLEGLRIADMSVTPFLPNCHVMSVAYLIGDMCKERLVEEYGLAS